MKVVKCGLIQEFKTTIDENGKFNYYSSDMRPVPPGNFYLKYKTYCIIHKTWNLGWYDLDKTKHRVPVGWYEMNQSQK